MVWKFRPKFRPNSDQNSDHGLKIQTKIQTKFRPISDQIQTKFRPKFRPWPDSCQCAELVLIVCWAHQVFPEWQARKPKPFGQHGKTQPFYLTLVTQGKGHFRLLRAMQLKIAQKILNLSFKDKSWLKLKIHPKILNIFKNPQNVFFPKISRILKIFWGFGPSK